MHNGCEIFLVLLIVILVTCFSSAAQEDMSGFGARIWVSQTESKSKIYIRRAFNRLYQMSNKNRDMVSHSDVYKLYTCIYVVKE